MAQEAKASTERLTQLREKIIRHFDLEELRTLCADLGVDYADLPGEGRAAKVRELVAYFERQSRIAGLVERCRQLRSNFDGETAAETDLLVNVPQLPTHALVGRDEMLANLRARLMSGGTVALSALNGLPGVGKTTLAV